MKIIKRLAILLIVILFGVIFYIGGSYECSSMRDHSLELYYCKQSYTQFEIMIAEITQIIMTFTIIFIFVVSMMYIFTLLFKAEGRKTKIERFKLYKCRVKKDLDQSKIKPDAIKNLGYVGIFEPVWLIEDGEFKGQYAMKCWDIRYWYPEEDLEILKEIEDER